MLVTARGMGKEPTVVETADLWPLGTGRTASGSLTVAGHDLVALAGAYGTPAYVFDDATIRDTCRRYRAALATHAPGASRVHYAGKAWLATGLARLIAAEGLGLDVVSAGELAVALRAGADPAMIHLHGNATPTDEVRLALAAGIGQIVIDSLDALQRLVPLVAGRQRPQPVALRLTPEVAAETHHHIQTGHASAKFGLPLAALDAAARALAAADGMVLTALHAHLGSQIFSAAPFAAAIEVLLACAVRLRDAHQIVIDEINIGGGLGVPTAGGQAPLSIEAYAAALGTALRDGCRRHGFAPLRLVIEPGRSIIARAGVALYRVIASKPLPAGSDAARYLHLDGGMGDNIRPALYGAQYHAVLAAQPDAPADETVHLAGRYCESGDVLIHGIPLPRAAIGDVVALASAGAYTLSMASNYNWVPRPPALLLRRDGVRLLQRRETIEDMLARDVPVVPA